MDKLKGKIGTPKMINKAFNSEAKVVYKFKDIEDIIIN